jgi:hypothetical protein
MEAYKKGIGKKHLNTEFEPIFKESGNNDLKNLNAENKQTENDELLKNEDLVDDDDLNEAAIDNNKKLANDDCELDEFINEHFAYLKQKKEEKEKKYYVEPVEPWKDFSEHGDFAIAMEAGQEYEYKEYLKKVEEMKKKRAYDDKMEKEREKSIKDKRAKLAAQYRYDRKINMLKNKVKKLKIEGDVIGFSDANKLIKLAVPKIYHKVIDHSGKTIAAAEFVEISQTRSAFYLYDNISKTYKLFLNSEETANFTFIGETKTQKELWDIFKDGFPIDQMGFLFRKHIVHEL